VAVYSPAGSVMHANINNKTVEIFLYILNIDSCNRSCWYSANIWFVLVSVWSASASHTCSKLRLTSSRASICQRCCSCLVLTQSSTPGSHLSLPKTYVSAIFDSAALKFCLRLALQWNSLMMMMMIFHT